MSSAGGSNETLTRTKEMKNGKQYYINAILADRIGPNGTMEYFINWRGFDDRDNTWETESDIADDALVEWEDKKARRQVVRVEAWLENVEDQASSDHEHAPVAIAPKQKQPARPDPQRPLVTDTSIKEVRRGAATKQELKEFLEDFIEEDPKDSSYGIKLSKRKGTFEVKKLSGNTRPPNGG